MYVLKYARGRRVSLTPLGQGLGPASRPDGPTAEGTVVDAGDGILVRIHQVPEGFPPSGWFRADLYVLHGGYRLLGWGRAVSHGHLHFTPRGQPEVLFLRSSARVPLEVRLVYAQPAGDDLTQGGSEGITQDISMDGVGLLGSRAAPEGTRLHIRFTDPPLDALGTVKARVRSAARAADRWWHWQLGCRFEGLNPAQRAVLRRVVSEQARLLTRPAPRGTTRGSGPTPHQAVGTAARPAPVPDQDLRQG